MVDINVPGLVSIIVFYLLILVIGILAARKKDKNTAKAQTTEEETNEVILAGRNIGMFVGCFTMTGKPKIILKSSEKITQLID